MKKGFLLAAAGALLGALSAQAQEMSSFTAAGYVALALARSPEVREAAESFHEADASYRSQFAAAALPTLSFSAQDYPYGYNPANSYVFNGLRLDRSPLLFNTGLSWNLFNSFQDYRKTREARLARESAQRTLDAARQDRSLSALQAYYDLDLRARLLNVADRNLQDQKDQYDQTLDLYRHGFRSLADLLKSETDVASSQLRRVQAEADRKSSLLAFNLLVDRPPQAEAFALDDLQAGATALPDVGSDLGRALSVRPEIARARSDLERAEVARRQARQGLLPSLSANLYWSRQDVNGSGAPSALNTLSGIPNPNYQAGITLSLPLSFNFLSQAETYLGARAEVRREQAAFDAAARQVRQDLYSSYISLERAVSAYAIAQRKEELAGRNLDLVMEEYKTGSADVIRLAQARTDLLDAQVERAGDLHEILIDRALYRRALGAPLW